MDRPLTLNSPGFWRRNDRRAGGSGGAADGLGGASAQLVEAVVHAVELADEQQRTGLAEVAGQTAAALRERARLEPLGGELADHDRVARVAGGLQRVVALVDEAPVVHRRGEDLGVVGRLGAEVLAEVRLVEQCPEVHRRQRFRLSFGGEVPAVARAHGPHPLAVGRRVGLPGEEQRVGGAGLRRLGLSPTGRAAREREVDGDAVGGGDADDVVEGRPVARRVGVGIGGVEVLLLLGSGPR